MEPVPLSPRAAALPRLEPVTAFESVGSRNSLRSRGMKSINHEKIGFIHVWNHRYPPTDLSTCLQQPFRLSFEEEEALSWGGNRIKTALLPRKDGPLYPLPECGLAWDCSDQ